MKISMIGPVTPYRGGIAHFTTLLAKKLMDAGHEIQVISFKKQYPAWLYPGESDKDHSPERLKVDAQFTLKPLNPCSWHKTLRTLLDFQPEQVLFPWWVTFLGPAFHFLIKRIKKRGIPVVILIHNTMPHETKPWDRFLAKQTLQDADRFIVMTEKEKLRLLNLLPTAQNIQVSPLPIYNAFKPSAKTREVLRQQMGLAPDQPVILFFGFIRPYKGLHLLIDAFKGLLDGGKQAYLLIVGEFWDDQQDYLQQIQALDIQENIHIVDRYVPDDEIAGYFKVADVFVAPYVGGTQSAVLKTALGFGLPCVATEIIADSFLKTLSERCIFVPTGTPDALARGIAQQLSLKIQDRVQIDALVEGSWQDMLAACAQAATKPSPDTQQEGEV